ncbi:MAG: Unknown protein [uncultured Thiotrichaceae bacterium]|uniref:YcgL domain-containing protein HELGO_WM22419 n=1 Tax=uncultured Thiotrichaceae bacterium TaxID=298394 RepID=A0A6S6TXW5_9GAMM|nr:MAG: Unknown protein [uncultured Thiotrichaceae bacterium]
MQCYVYRSKHRHQTYLFLPKQGDFSEVPESLVKLFGETEFSFRFELTETRQLVLADATEVLQHINENGFFLQMPPGDKTKYQGNPT